VYFVRTGRVRVVKEPAGEPAVRLAEFGPGDFFGEMSLVESVVRSASVGRATALSSAATSRTPGEARRIRRDG
jgi:CRP-like cAMP-binding protein